MGSQVVLELTRDGPPGDEAQPRDETWYTLRRKDGSSAKARFPWSRVLPDLQAAALWSTPGAEARLRVGEAVRVFLQQLGWSREEAEILDALKEGGGAADVHVTIRSATELCRLPMEVLPLGASGEALGRKKGCHVQWEWPGASMAPRVLPAPPEGGALLFAWSTAGGVLDAPSQLRAIQEATRTHRHPTRPELLPGASLERLQQALDSIRARGQSVAVLHLLCHGAPLPGDGGGFGLALDGQGGGTVTVDPASCADALAPYAGLVGCVVLCACHGANLVDAPGVLGSVAQRLHRAGFPAVVASRVPLSSAGAESFTEAFHGALLAGEPFHRAVAAGRRRLGTEWAALQVYGWEAATPLYPVVFRPYRGLRSFETSDRRFFFGRKALTEQLRARVIEALDGGKPRFQLVAGTSGSGKSSLVKAGLIPSLPEAWRHAVLRPGGDGAIRETGMGRLLRALADVQGAPAGHGGEVSEEAVIAQARRFREKWPGSPLLLVVDQLEETFRLEGDEPRRFLGCLWRLAKDEPLKIVVLSTFRADLLEPAQGMVLEGDLTLQNVVYREAHRLYVESMSSTELLDAIRRPLDEVGLTFESGIAEQLRDEAGKEPGALPLLEHALDALWQERRDRVLTRKAYEHLGGLSGALSRQLDGLWDTLPAAQQRQGQRLLVALTDVTEDVALSTRRRERVEKLRPKGGASAAAFDAVLEGLVARRLLVRGQLEDLGASSRGGWVEVAHEALIRRWTRLQSWLHKDRAEAAWAKRWLRRAVIAMAIAGALVVFQLVLLGVTRFREAKHERDEAISRELTLRVTATLESGDPQLNLALLRKAGDLAATEQLVSALALWEASPGRVVMQGHQTRVKVARFFPGGLRILTAGDDATARIWSADTGKPVAVLTGHVDSVLAAGLSPDSRRVLTASADQTARIWDAATGELIAVLSGHSAPVLAADFSPDGLRVLTASADRTARVWDSTTGRSLGVLSGHGRPVLAASFSPDGLRVLTASADKTARIWEGQTGKQLAVLTGHSSAVLAAGFSPDSLRVLTASADWTARIWEGQTGKQLAVLTGHSDAVLAAGFSPDGLRVLTASADRTARTWDGSTGKPLAALSGHGGPVLAASFSPDGFRVLTAGADGTARTWNAASGRPLTMLSGHSGAVLSAAFSPDGVNAVTAGDDGTARVWVAAGGKPLATLSGHSGEVKAGAFSPDGRRYVTASLDGTAWIWDAVTGRPLATLSGHASGVVAVAFSPDGRRILSTSRDATARVWDAETGKLLATLSGHTGTVWQGTFSPDGLRVLTASDDATARVWEVATGRSLMTLAGHAGPVLTASFSPDGLRALTGSTDAKWRVWDAETGRPLDTFSGHLGPVLAAAFSPDGRRLVTASTDATARVWEATGLSWTPLAVLSGHSGPVLMAQFSPDGRRIVTASRDRSARVWDVATGTLVATLSGHSGDVLTAAFSPEGLCLVTASTDQTARAWDAATGKPLVTLSGHSGPVLAAAFSPDGLRIATSSADHTARIWRDLLWAPPAFQRKLLGSGRDLTQEERRTYLHEVIEPAGARSWPRP